MKRVLVCNNTKFGLGDIVKCSDSGIARILEFRDDEMKVQRMCKKDDELVYSKNTQWIDVLAINSHTRVEFRCGKKRFISRVYLLRSEEKADFVCRHEFQLDTVIPLTKESFEMLQNDSDILATVEVAEKKKVREEEEESKEMHALLDKMTERENTRKRVALEELDKDERYTVKRVFSEKFDHNVSESSSSSDWGDL